MAQRFMEVNVAQCLLRIVEHDIIYCRIAIAQNQAQYTPFVTSLVVSTCGNSLIANQIKTQNKKYRIIYNRGTTKTMK